MMETTCKAQVCLAMVSECLAAYPGTAATGSVILAVLLYSIYETYFSVRPLLCVDGIPWRGPYGFTRKDGLMASVRAHT